MAIITGGQTGFQVSNRLTIALLAVFIVHELTCSPYIRDTGRKLADWPRGMPGAGEATAPEPEASASAACGPPLPGLISHIADICPADFRSDPVFSSFHLLREFTPKEKQPNTGPTPFPPPSSQLPARRETRCGCPQARS